MRIKTFGLRSILIAITILSLSVARVDYRIRAQQSVVRSIAVLGGQAFDRNENLLSDSYFDNLAHSLASLSVPNIKLEEPFIEQLKRSPRLNLIKIRGGDFEEVDIPTIKHIRFHLPTVEIENGYVDLLDAID